LRRKNAALPEYLEQVQGVFRSTGNRLIGKRRCRALSGDASETD
jgi:hypothetical protein